MTAETPGGVWGSPRSAPTPSASRVRVLLLLNLQNDFLEGGQFPLAGADDAIEEAVRLRELKAFDHVVVWQTVHSLNHRSFASNNPGTELLELSPIADVGPCVMWPDHCVVGTNGAKLHPLVTLDSSEVLLTCNIDPSWEKYSAFEASKTESGQSRLRQFLTTVEAAELYICGFAMEFSVMYTARDARLSANLAVFVIEDACASVSAHGMEDARLQLQAEQVQIISSVDGALDAIPNRARVTRLPGEPDGQDWYRDVVTSPERVEPAPLQSPTRRYVDPITATATAHNAVRTRNLNLLQELISIRSPTLHVNVLLDVNGRSVLHVAAGMGNAQALELALSNGASADLPNSDGETPLHYAAASGQVHSIQRLLIAGASVMASNHNGLTPLMLAIIGGHVETVLELLRWSQTAWEQLLACTSSGTTPLMFAMAATKKTLHRNISDWELDDMPSSLGSISAASAPAVLTTDRRSGIITLIMDAAGTSARRLQLLRTQDKLGWSPLHFGAKSGLLACMNWDTLLTTEDRARLPVNLQTHDGLSLLHIVAWNGRCATLASLMGVDVLTNTLPGQKPARMPHLEVNKFIGALQLSEVDLALHRRFYLSARLLLRIGGHVHSSGSLMADGFLNYLIFTGDSVGVELLLRDEQNQLSVTPSLVDITKRIKYPDSCTFTFAGYNHTISQHMFLCTVCRQNVCLVCALKCHPTDPTAHQLQPQHALQYLGHHLDTHCGCQKDKCCALSVVDAREAEGYKYVPNPIAAQGVQLDAVVRSGRSPSAVVQLLAQQLHEVWAAGLVQQGWSHGPNKDEQSKQHPALLPIDKLAEGDRYWNMLASQQMLMVLGALGYSLTRTEEPDQEASSDHSTVLPTEPVRRGPRTFPKVLHHDSTDNPAPRRRASRPGAAIARLAPGAVSGAGGGTRLVYRPAPLDTSTIELSQAWLDVLELLASNTHELWAECLMKIGWRYAPDRATHGERADRRRKGPTSPLLVPYHMLNEKEKQQARNSITEMFKCLVHDGWTLELMPGATLADQSQLKHKIPAEQLATMRQRLEQLSSFKQGVFSAFLFAAARQGNSRILRMLLSSDAGTGITVNSVDDTHRTPLFHAVQRSHLEAAQLLLNLGADINMKDELGISPLAAAAFQNNMDMIELLIRHGAQLTDRDVTGLNALHYAVLAENRPLISALGVKLCAPGMPGIDMTTDGATIMSHMKRLLPALSRSRSRSHSAAVHEEPQPPEDDPNTSLITWRISPLTLAVCKQDVVAIDLLLRLGADPLLLDGSGLRPYERALLMHALCTRDDISESPVSGVSADASGLLQGLAPVPIPTDYTPPVVQDDDSLLRRARRRSSTSLPQRPLISASQSTRQAPTARGATKPSSEPTDVLVQSLSCNERVQVARVSMAWRALFKQVALFLVTILLFALVTPSAPDYPSTVIATYRSDLYSALTTTLPNGPTAPADWWAWFDSNILWLGPAANQSDTIPASSVALMYRPTVYRSTLLQPGDDSAFASMLGLSTLIGALRLSVTQRVNTPCVGDWGQSRCVSLTDNGPTDVYILSASNVTARRAVAAPHRPSDAYIYGGSADDGSEVPTWTDKSVAQMTLEWGVLNEHADIFGWITIVLAPSPSGVLQLTWAVDALWMPDGRFPPSALFRTLVAVVLAIQLATLFWGLRSLPLRRWLASGWNVYEMLTALGLGAVLILDVIASRELSELRVADGSTDEVVDIQAAVAVTQAEFDVMGVVLLMLAVRFVKYARLTPGWGPMVVAIVMTSQHTTVLLYLGVALGLIVGIAIMFTVQLGAVTPMFSTVKSSFSTLFFMLFAGNWNTLDAVPSGVFQMVTFMVFVLFAIVLVNLFIGIVTDIYPVSRARSKQEWDNTVTSLMEDEVLAQWAAGTRRSWVHIMCCCMRDRSQTAVPRSLLLAAAHDALGPMSQSSQGAGHEILHIHPQQHGSVQAWMEQLWRDRSRAFPMSSILGSPRAAMGTMGQDGSGRSQLATLMVQQANELYAETSNAPTKALLADLQAAAHEPKPLVRMQLLQKVIVHVVARLRAACQAPVLVDMSSSGGGQDNRFGRQESAMSPPLSSNPRSRITFESQHTMDGIGASVRESRRHTRLNIVVDAATSPIRLRSRRRPTLRASSTGLDEQKTQN